MTPDMTPGQLVGLAARHGFSLVRTETGFSAAPRPGKTKADLPADVAAALRANRAALIAWFDGHAGAGRDQPPGPDPGAAAGGEQIPRRCRAAGCGAWGFVGAGITPADVRRCCDRGESRCQFR